MFEMFIKLDKEL